MASILEEWVESSLELPTKLQAAFATIRSLDEEDAALQAGIDAMLASRAAAAAAVSSQPPLTASQRKARADAAAAEAATIDADAALICEHATTKFTQAAECYDMVDLHIRRLDKDLALFDKEAARLGAGGDSPDRAAAMAAAMAAAAAGGKPAKSHAKRSGKAGGGHGLLPFGALGAAGGALGVLGGGLAGRAELAVDPNEPLYCSCQRVSFGDMVACEADTCPIEWFHYECVGLPAGQEPKGKWYCPGCAAQKQGKRAKLAGGGK